MISKLLGISFILAFGFLSPALAGARSAPRTSLPVQTQTINSENQDSYYTVKESFTKTTGFEEFGEFSSTQFIQATKVLIVNLLRWNLHDETRPQPEDPYARKLHFGRWINDPFDDTCMNTRARVLVRDSETDVTYRNKKNCIVHTGRWYDAYSDQDFESAKEIQVDHMVPLKNAYISGAWQWDYKTRCLYANYMGFRNHLVPASVHENTSKGDRGPEKYLPANANYRCQYIKDWLAIKLIWALSLTADEATAIEAVVQEEGCDTSDFRMSKAELKEQRETIGANLDYCLATK